jgi:hypothetical protein
MKKALIIGIMTLVALSITMSALAQVAQTAPKIEKIEGTIKLVDAAKNTITITTMDKVDKAITVNEKTKITVDGTVGALATLKVGQKATLEVTGTTAMIIAVVTK